MQDPRALKNPKNLSAWRAWRQEAYRRSGFLAITSGVPLLTVAFVFACTLYRRALTATGTSILLTFGLYLAAVSALMAIAMLRLRAWERAHPWTPPS